VTKEKQVDVFLAAGKDEAVSGAAPFYYSQRLVAK
jgi:hypothetical protein